MGYKFTLLKTGGSSGSTGGGYVFKRLSTKYYPPTIESHDGDYGIIIYENTQNGDRTKAYNVYISHSNKLVDNVLRTGNTSYCSYTGYSVYVKAVDEDGNESEASNVVSPATCFVAGTAVLMADNTYKMIEEIVVGDKVKSYNFKVNTYCAGEVTRVAVGYTNRLAMVTYSNSTFVVMSEGHPLYTKDGWHSITNKNDYPTLTVGDYVLCGSTYIEITDIQTFDVENTAVYSLEVAVNYKNETLEGAYFAGFGGMAMATHNGGMGD